VALNLRNAEIERLASEVAALTNESKTEAIRKALEERKSRLLAARRPHKRSERAAGILQEFRASLPKTVRQRPLSREEEDGILGFGPGGV
jgi:antitoxin VapB